MPRGRELSELEVRKIWFYKGSGKSEREISKILKRSKTAIHNVLSKRDFYGKYKRSGRKNKVSARDKRQIFKLATKQNLSTRKITQQTSKNISHMTVWRTLRSNSNVALRKLKRKPRLLKNHKEQRLKWAKEVMTWDATWKNIIFSDEKKFNLDGPDGNIYYWHDLRTEPRDFFSRQMGGGSVMVWGAFAYDGKCDLQRVSGNMDSICYQQLLYQHLIPFGPFLGGSNWKFQQDNAPCHVSKSTKNWFQKERIEVLNWPSRSPDLNPTENLWGHLARQVYANNRQYDSVYELELAIVDKWDKIPKSLLENLINSMKNRVFEVIQKNGGSTSF